VVHRQVQRHRAALREAGEQDVIAGDAARMFAMNQRRDSAALANFYICDSLSRALDTDGPSGFMVMTNLKIGMIDDQENKREYALIQYNKVLSWKDFENAHDLAKKYIERPYGR